MAKPVVRTEPTTIQAVEATSTVWDPSYSTIIISLGISQCLLYVCGSLSENSLLKAFALASWAFIFFCPQIFYAFWWSHYGVEGVDHVPLIVRMFAGAGTRNVSPNDNPTPSPQPLTSFPRTAQSRSLYTNLRRIYLGGCLLSVIGLIVWFGLFIVRGKCSFSTMHQASVHSHSDL